MSTLIYAFAAFGAVAFVLALTLIILAVLGDPSFEANDTSYDQEERARSRKADK